MELQEKILTQFEGKVVRKDLTSLVKGNAVVPAYVLEYLLGQHCAINDEEVIKTGIEKVKDIIKNNFVHRSEAELVKSIIRESTSFKIIDKLIVSLNEKQDIYETTFANLGIGHVPISEEIVKKHNKLLSGGGVWCIITMSYNKADDAGSRWIIEGLKPIQVSGVNLEEYIGKRKEFTTDEWLDLLLHSMGLNPAYFNRRGKFIQLSRLLPHVENNYNFVELGPKGTGKSHIFSELSPHGVLVSGGDVTSARLFVNNIGRGQIGLVGFWDVVCLDEFEQVVGSKRADGDMVNIMQNYMANKSFNRGKETFQAYASFAFVGNTKRPVPYMLKHSHLFESIPEAYVKGAFLDRIHIYIPGWEVDILKENIFSREFGFIVDYLAEILSQFRKLDYSNLIDQYADLDPSYSGRDKMAVRKTFSGMVKLIYPDLQMTEEEAVELLNFAIEGRKRVKDQLYFIDETFRNSPVEFKYTLKSTGKEVTVETLEKLNYRHLLKPMDEQEEGQTAFAAGRKQPDLLEDVPQPGELVIRDNQTGISYERLFGKYIRGARKITLVDPYIRLPYQFRNLMEFSAMLADNKAEDEVVELKVITWNTVQFMQDSIYNFNEITDQLLDMGIHLTHEFEELHDRYIQTDTGWKIVLGRGLDIFEPREGKFNIADVMQEKRKCKNCTVVYIKGK